MSEDYSLINVDVAEPMFGFQLGKRLLRTHGPAKCVGSVCCIHNPSEHHMRTWPQNWRGDTSMMERICEHGNGHPDPDDLAVRTTDWAGIHGCCTERCCRDPQKGHEVGGRTITIL